MDFQGEELKEILNIFQIESEEIIERLNITLLELEKSPTNKDLIVQLFRDAHSLKGAARMIGFSNTQNIAHKLEDLLGLAKDNQLQMTTEIADAMYKSVDLITKIISQSISNGKEVFSESEIEKQLQALEKLVILETVSTEPLFVEQETDFNITYFRKYIDRINYLMVDFLLNIVHLTEEIKNEYITKIFEDTTELIEHFQKINHFDIKSELENIKLKVEVVLKCNTELTPKEVEEFQQKADTLITNLSNLYINNDIKVIDYYSYAFEGKNYEKGIEKFNQETANVEVVSEIPNSNIRTNISEEKFNFEDLKNKIKTLSKTTKHAPELKTKLNQLKDSYPNSDFAPLLTKLFELISFIQKVNVVLEEVQLEILSTCANYCFDSINNENPIGNVELLIQQLTVTQQLIELANPVTETATEVVTVEKNATEKTNNEKINTKNLKDFSKLLNSGEIKTLHVESTKLDAMVNQIGELISTKIKTTKHLSEISTIEKNLEESQKDFAKLLRHIKQYDKKFSPIDSKHSDNSSAILLKQFIYTLSEQNKRLNSIVTQLNEVQRSTLEDDMKMRLLIDDFDTMIKNIRILPLATVFHLFGRMVRDIAKESGKEVELTITGSETSADKKIIEEIKNPLIHIIRNSVDHGIETPERRKELGKSPTGHIQINAKHHENHILIEIIDDGQGFDIEKIKAKAINKNFLTEEAVSQMSDKEILNLVFLPGFTTGEEVTSISGRGIGMDIVKSTVAQLNGTVNIISEFNKGTKIQINLPITMATITAFLIQASNQTFAIPMSVINTIICKRKEELIYNQDTLTILYNEQNIPLYNLSDILNLEPIEETTTLKTILIIETNNKTVGIIVDKLLGEQEILQKSLSLPLKRLKNISGITTLASGETCLILNALDLMKNATSSQMKHFANSRQTKITDKKDLLKNKNILIIDDSQTIRTLEKNILTTANFNVKTASKPSEAIKLMNQNNFDLIITDIEMPEMNGFEFLTQIKTNDKFAQIPVIIMSSLFDDNVRKKSLSLGAEKFIIKGDFKQKSFIDEISQILIKYSN